MTTRIDNDGPAYPFEIENKSTEDIPDIFGGVVRAGTTRVYAGLTLRDAFAISALTSGQASNWRDNDYSPVNGLSIIENTARHAYEIADAMLRARSQGEPDAS